MTTKLFVASLPYSLGNQELEQIFSACGSVQSCKIILDADGRSKGFGFVEMSNEAEAKQAITQLNGTIQAGRSILVSEARPQVKREGGGGFGQRNNRSGGNGGGRY
jgi:RNA recognition motif-containing protein